MLQLILHLFGDYLIQSDWMALNKTKAHIPALAHALVYSLPFLILTANARHPFGAILVIFATHFLIDRYRLARYVVWVKNWLGPISRRETRQEAIQRCLDMGLVSRPVMKEHEKAVLDREMSEEGRRIISCNLPWSECSATGYPPERPAWLTVWLMIAADNTLHLAINYAALRWL